MRLEDENLSLFANYGRLPYMGLSFLKRPLLIREALYSMLSAAPPWNMYPVTLDGTD